MSGHRQRSTRNLASVVGPLGAALLSSLFWAAAPARAAEGEKDAASHYSAGKKAFEEGEFSKAIEELEAAVATKPNPKAYLLLGNAATKIGELDKARKAFEAFLTADPHSSKRKTVESLITELGVLAKTKLMVTSTPPGATVYLDLKAEGARGKTPFELPAVPGAHRVMLELAGFDPASESAVAVEGQQVPVSFALKPRGCDLTVETTPLGATFQVDDAPPTGAPTTLRITTGRHALRFSGTGLEPRTESVNCEGAKPFKLSVRMEARRFGVLVVHLDPGSQLSIDGRPQDGKAAIDVPSGDHLVDVLAPGKAPWHLEVAVGPGQRLELTPRLDSGGKGGPSGVAVAATPQDATVTIDGNPTETGQTVVLKPGPHEIRVSAPGHLGVLRELTLTPGELVRVEAHLAPRGRTALALGITSTVLAAASEGLGLFGHFRANQQIAGSHSYDQYHQTELAGHIAAGSFAALAVIGYAIAGAQMRTIEEAPRTRVSAGVSSTGGAVLVQRSF